MGYPYLQKKSASLRVGPFNGGVMLDTLENEISDIHSPDMLNMVFSNGILKKREGQKILFDNGDADMNSCFKEVFNGYIIYHAGERIKAYNISTGEIKTFNMYIPGRKGEFFSYNGRVYYVGTGEYYRISFEDDELKLEVAEGYAPLRYINCDPNTGIGDDNEPANLLTGSYRASYNVIDDMTVLYLPGNIDKDNIKVEYNGNTIDPSYYTYDEAGYLSFSKLTFKAGHNALTVTVTDTSAESDRGKITNCNAVAYFGGSSSGLSEGTRVFLAGNREYANTFFRSELKNPEYFPVDAYEILGDTIDPIVGFGKQGGGLVIFKEKSIYISLYEYSSGEAIFTVTNISADKGCDCKDTILSADNRLLWFNSGYGVMALSSTGKNNEKNVSVISGNVNGAYSGAALLNKDSYENASAFIYKNRYHLCLEDYCYVFDFENSPASFASPENLIWFLYSNIQARFSVRDGSKVYLAGSKERFTYFSDCLYDLYEDSPICSHYVTKAFDLGNPNIFKTVKDISLLIRAEEDSYTEISCYDEDGKIKEFEGIRVNKFSFLNFNFPGFTFYGNRFSIFLRRKVNRRRVKFFSLKFKNYQPLSDMAISALTVNYKPERGVKLNGI